ncbi:MAG: flavodoxin family protein [Pseudomonadota bacterium]
MSEKNKKVFIVNGSHKGRKGNTHVLVEAFIKGIKKANAQFEYIVLNELKIESCKACFYCWRKTKGLCCINDDMKTLIEKFIASDFVVLASPLYIDNVSALMKNFMDRLVPILDPRFELDENNESLHKKRYSKYPDLIAISNCGYPEQSHFQAISLLFKRMTRNMHCKLIAEIYKEQGSLLKVDRPLHNPNVDSYLSAVEEAAHEIMKHIFISSETKKKLSISLSAKEDYLKEANEFWEKALKKIET